MPGIDTRSEALRVLLTQFDTFDGARPAVDRVDDPADPQVREAASLSFFNDDRVTTDDLQAIADSAGFSDDE